MSEPIQLIVGLGNPGAEYQRTRHNAGFWFLDALGGRHDAGAQLLDRLLKRTGAGLSLQRRFKAEVGRLAFDGRECWLLKPVTFMNASGQAVGAFARFHHIDPVAILIVHDELDLEPGVVRLKQGGGHGGHNGLRDIVAHLGANTFMRLRIGIGHPRGRGDEDVLNYVLKAPGAEDRKAIEGAIDSALRVLPRIVCGEAEQVMNELHRRAPGT